MSPPGEMLAILGPAFPWFGRAGEGFAPVGIGVGCANLGLGVNRFIAPCDIARTVTGIMRAGDFLASDRVVEGLLAGFRRCGEAFAAILIRCSSRCFIVSFWVLVHFTGFDNLHDFAHSHCSIPLHDIYTSGNK